MDSWMPANASQGVLLAENEISAVLVNNDADTYSISANPGDMLHITRLGPDSTIYLGLDTAPGTGQGGELLHFDLNGNLLGTIHLPNDSSGFFFYPFGFTVAPDGTFWVPQPNSGNVAHVDASGNLIRSYFVGGDPADAAVRSDGQVFIANPYFLVQQLDPASGSVTVFTNQPIYPIGLTFASAGGNGNLLVSDFFNGVEYFNNSGKPS